MKKFGIALIAAVTFAAPAFAADMAARPYTKAPMAPPPPVISWTGCYLGAGGGGGFYNTESDQVTNPAGAFINTQGTSGGRGWFGTVGGGCDYQFGNFVVGAFGDYDFMDIHGTHIGPGATGVRTDSYGTLKEDWKWSVGGRVGYLVLPQLLTYVSGGYTEAHFQTVNYSAVSTGLPNGATLPGGSYGGWFIGTGDEYALSFLPGLFWKTEYRFSQYDRKMTANVNSGVVQAFGESVKPYDHTVRSELVYRFNWGR